MNKKQPNQEFIITILDTIRRNKNASAKMILKTIKKLKECNQTSTTIPYSTICRLLRGYLFKREYVKPDYKNHMPPSKENFYKLTSKGKEFLEGHKVESLEDKDVIIFPKDCLLDCGKEQMEKCWEEKFQWLEERFKTKLNESQKTEIKKVLKEPVKITQIEAYFELIKTIEKEIKPFFNKNLMPQIQKISKINEKIRI